MKQIREFAATENAEVVVISARAEEEIAELDDEDKAEFLEALGLEESGVDKLTKAAYHLYSTRTCNIFYSWRKRSACLDFQTWHESSSIGRSHS